jgi:hypothetical protein
MKHFGVIMKRYINFLILTIFFLTQSAYGIYVAFSGADWLPATFTVDDASSELGTCPAGPYVFAYNGTAGVVDWGIGAGVDTLPGAVSGQIPANTGVDLQGYVEWNGSDAFFIQANGSSSISAGYFILQCSGHN